MGHLNGAISNGQDCARPANQEKTTQIVASWIWLFCGFTTGFTAKNASSSEENLFESLNYSQTLRLRFSYRDSLTSYF